MRPLKASVTRQSRLCSKRATSHTDSNPRPKMTSSGLQLLAQLEVEFAESKSCHFRGAARVRPSQLFFPDPIRALDPKIITELKRDFKAEGCFRHEKDCSIPALIDDDGFCYGLRASGIHTCLPVLSLLCSSLFSLQRHHTTILYNRENHIHSSLLKHLRPSAEAVIGFRAF